jgi:tRNA(adenine34) deaminase
MALQAWMQLALTEAQAAMELGEVPVGAVLVYQEQAIVKDHNRTEHSEKPLQHAEMRVLEKATQLLAQEQMRESTLFVNLEPCPMCMGAILHCHIGRVVYGAYNLKWGACGSVCDFSASFPGQSIELIGGISEKESQTMLSSFFERLRHKTPKY